MNYDVCGGLGYLVSSTGRVPLPEPMVQGHPSIKEATKFVRHRGECHKKIERGDVSKN